MFITRRGAHFVALSLLPVACGTFDPQALYPTEVDEDGKPIVVAYSFRHVGRIAAKFPGEGGTGRAVNLRARPTYVDGVPTIFIDRLWYETLPYAVQAFAYYHEVGHLKLGHLSGADSAT